MKKTREQENNVGARSPRPPNDIAWVAMRGRHICRPYEHAMPYNAMATFKRPTDRTGPGRVGSWKAYAHMVEPALVFTLK